MMSATASEAGEDTVELQVQKITLPMPAKLDQAAMARRYAEADGLRRKFGGCKTMAGLAKEAGDARYEDLKYIKPSSIPEPTRSLLLSAKDGDMLPPATAAAGIEVYAVCGRRADQGRREAAREGRGRAGAEGVRDRGQAPSARPQAGCAHRISVSDRHDRLARDCRTSHRAGAGEPARLPPIAVTMGDPAGIGPDITLMSWHQRVAARAARLRALRRPGRAAGAGARARARRADRRSSPALRRRRRHSPRRCPSAGAGRRGSSGDAAIVAAIERGDAAVAAGEALALVTNPITKRSLDLAHLPYPGHTEFLAELAVRSWRRPRPRPVMMLAAEELKVVPATVHIPLAAVPAALTRPLLLETDPHHGGGAHRAISASPGRASPSPGLNPHAGEGGLIGREETDADRARRRRARRRGPGRDRSRTPPTRCSTPRRAPPTMRPSPCITTRR